MAYGWIAIGLLMGRHLSWTLKWGFHPATRALLGTMLLTVLIGALGFVPVPRTIVPLLLAAIGLGAVFLTRFDLQEYVPATRAHARHPR